MKVFIPTIGTILILEKPWTFALHAEQRNTRFIERIEKTGMCIPKVKNTTGWYSFGAIYLNDITLPEGTILTVSRIYIRQGNKDFDSVTFSVKAIINNIKVKGRFWAKLCDVNKMEITVL